MERKCEVKGKTPRITHNSVSPVWMYPYKKKEKKIVWDIWWDVCLSGLWLLKPGMEFPHLSTSEITFFSFNIFMLDTIEGGRKAIKSIYSSSDSSYQPQEKIRKSHLIITCHKLCLKSLTCTIPPVTLMLFHWCFSKKMAFPPLL